MRSMAVFLYQDLLDHSFNPYLQKEQALRDHPVVILTKFKQKELKLKNQKQRFWHLRMSSNVILAVQ